MSELKKTHITYIYKLNIDYKRISLSGQYNPNFTLDLIVIYIKQCLYGVGLFSINVMML